MSLLRLFVLALLCAATAGRSLAAAPACDPDDGGLTLPEGFCALVVGDELGRVRQLAVAPNGDLWAARTQGRGGVLALRDTDGDGRADLRREFGPSPAHGLLLTPTHLYLAADDRVLRWPWKAGQLEPAGPPETVVGELPVGRQHARKAIAIGHDGSLFVNVGAPSNACQQQIRTPRSPGLDPCPQRERHAGIWRFRADRVGQRFADGTRWASGMRHTLALATHPVTGGLYGAINGRDQLGELWGFSAEQNAELPAEEFVRIERGDDYGWPYCYHDGLAKQKVLAPEYGGDGRTQGRCAQAKPPALAFPAHWAPMGLAFSHGAPLPARYRAGAFVSFHGSWNRAPLPQQGYRVVFVPFSNGAPSGGWERFAIGSASPTAIRPTGVAVGRDGSLYIAGDQSQRIWRVISSAAAPPASR